MRRLIAEIGSCNGDLQYAYDAVDAFAEAGVWAIKGQLYRADTLVTKDAKPYGKGLQEPATQFEAFSDALTYDEWGLVADRCREKHVEFFGSVFDLEAAQVGLVGSCWSYVKVASGDITNRPLLEYVASREAVLKGWVHVFLSTGASTQAEVVRATDLLTPGGYTVLACTLSYPCQLEDAHVDRIDTLRQMFPSVGYSDHTRGIAAADYAFRIGADFVEKHVTLTPGLGGDHDFAITPDQTRTLVSGDVYRSVVADSLVAGDHRLYPRDCEQGARGLARRSPYMTADVEAGGRVDDTNTVMLRPGVGVSGFDIPTFATVDIRRGAVVTSGLVFDVKDAAVMD